MLGCSGLLMNCLILVLTMKLGKPIIDKGFKFVKEDSSWGGLSFYNCSFIAERAFTLEINIYKWEKEPFYASPRWVITRIFCFGNTLTSYKTRKTNSGFCLNFCASKAHTKVVVEVNLPFLVATTPQCRGGRYSFPWIAPLDPRYVPYIAER